MTPFFVFVVVLKPSLFLRTLWWLQIWGFTLCFVRIVQGTLYCKLENPFNQTIPLFSSVKSPKKWQDCQKCIHYIKPRVTLDMKNIFMLPNRLEFPQRRFYCPTSNKFVIYYVRRKRLQSKFFLCLWFNFSTLQRTQWFQKNSISSGSRGTKVVPMCSLERNGFPGKPWVSIHCSLFENWSKKLVFYTSFVHLCRNLPNELCEYLISLYANKLVKCFGFPWFNSFSPCFIGLRYLTYFLTEFPSLL